MTTYAERETSIASARPVELYAFAIGTTVWRYTTASEAVVYDGDTYEPEALSRSNIEDNYEVDKAKLTIKVPVTAPVAALFISSAPAEVISATLFRGHIGADDFVAVWKGRVVSASFTDATVADLTCESVFTSLRRPGLRRTYQLGCTHDLYGPGCGVNRATYEAAYEVTEIAGSTLTVPSASGDAANYFAGGYVEYTDAETGAPARRYIVSNTGTTVELASFPFGMAEGDTAKFYPGCSHNVTDCASKFSNYNRYGGMPFIPRDGNPFDGSRVF